MMKSRKLLVKEVSTTLFRSYSFQKRLIGYGNIFKIQTCKRSISAELREDICKIKNSPNFFVFAGKTNNIYETSKDHYKKLLHDNVIKTYQKAPTKLEALINMEAKSISTKLKISDRVERIARTPTFVTLKEHKDNFCSNPTCRLINPSKNKIGKVSKQLVEKINSDIIVKLQLSQWHNTDALLKWLNNITDKSNCYFIQFNIKEFYPSITQKVLHQTFKFAKQDTNTNKTTYAL